VPERWPVAVLTRDPADVQPYVAQLAALGLTVLAMPVTRTAAAPDPDAVERALGDGDYAAIVVASARAAIELARAAERIGMARGTATPPSELTLPDVWAVGPATKRALDAAGIAARLPPDVRDGAELAARLVAERDVAGKRVLVPRAEAGRVEAIEILRSAGAIVVDVVAYRTVAASPDDLAVQPGADALATSRAAVLCLFAPSQVSALAQILAGRGMSLGALRVAVCAIGETTAQALRDAGIEQVAVAAAPTPEGMARAASSVYPTRT
jgi:uroporphyrinogen-III synthase